MTNRDQINHDYQRAGSPQRAGESFPDLSTPVLPSCLVVISYAVPIGVLLALILWLAERI